MFYMQYLYQVNNFGSLTLLSMVCFAIQSSFNPGRAFQVYNNSMLTTITRQDYLRRHIALPQDHGSWVFLISPLLIGVFAGSSFTSASVYLIVAAFSAFLIRQPTTIVIKVISGRRPRRELGPALFWLAVYGLVGGLTLAALVLLGYPYLLYLAVPGLPVFAWHLYLVSKRAERRQLGVELVGSGVLALAAPAALWVSAGEPLVEGWLLWALVWFQSAASIVYAYLRLEQRSLAVSPARGDRMKMASRALAYSTFNLSAVTIMAVASLVPALLPLPYALQFLETVRGSFNPAIGVKPTSIGIRQLIVSSLFTVLFIITWNL
jgi:hypothetical protein